MGIPRVHRVPESCVGSRRKCQALHFRYCRMPNSCDHAVPNPSRQELSCNFNSGSVQLNVPVLLEACREGLVKVLHTPLFHCVTCLSRQSRKSISFHQEHIANLAGWRGTCCHMFLYWLQLLQVLLPQPGPGDEEEFAGHVLRASKGGADVVSELCSGIEEAMRPTQIDEIPSNAQTCSQARLSSLSSEVRHRRLPIPACDYLRQRAKC